MVESEKKLLAESRGELFQHLWDAAPDPLILVGQSGDIVLVNHQMLQLTGYEREKLEGQKLEILVPQRFREKHVHLRDNFRHRPKVREMGAAMELYLQGAGQEEIPVEVSLSPVEVRGQLFTIATVRDISARRAVQLEMRQKAEALSRSNAELEQFAYVASHDLQEPLRMISGYVQLLQRRYKGKLDQSADEFIQYAVDGAKRMQDLISDLLAYSRVTSKGGELVPVDMSEIMAKVLSNLEVAIKESGAQISVGSLPTIKADRTQMFQLLQNLVGNGIKFHGDKPPKITVSAQQGENFWEFLVQDDGIGIPPEYQEKIFVIFQRLHTRDKYPGTGIGLAICKKIVERHGGSIRVESMSGKGSSFYIRLPRVNSHTEEAV